MLSALAALAEPYARLHGVRPNCCREPNSPDERHLQALWHHDTWRPKHLALADGTPVEVLMPGRWNRSAGPDFQDALISVGGLLRRGDVELHLHPSDWDAHGHAGDPAYGAVVLHVTWFDAPSAKTLSSGVPTLALKPFVEREGAFDFTTLDLSAAPYSASTAPRPCRQRLEAIPGETLRLLEAAGSFRLLAKAKTFSVALASEDAFQAFYVGLLGAMGYGRNSAPFRRLAEEVPFVRIAAHPSLTRFAALAGVAGLLRQEQRDLWDLWWGCGLQPSLTPYAWDLRATRPANHPYRRLAGVVGVLHSIAELLELPLGDLPEALIEAAHRLAEPLGLKGALIGRSRANAMVTNLFVPYRLALGTLHPSRLRALPGEDIAQPMRDVWHHLTGTLQGLPKDGLRQQGLLQVYSDFCHNPHLTCATCPLA